MKAAQLYKQWSEQVESDWNRLGLERIRGRGCKWYTRIGDSTLLLFVVVNPKYPWTVQGGGNFSVAVYVPTSRPEQPERYVENVFDSIEFFSLWTDTLIERRQAANQRVYEKIRTLDRTTLFAQMAEAYDCTPAQAEALGLYETELEIMEMDIEESSDVLLNPPLYFYDAQDVTVWSELLTASLPVVLKRLRERDVQSFRLGEPG